MLIDGKLRSIDWLANQEILLKIDCKERLLQNYSKESKEKITYIYPKEILLKLIQLNKVEAIQYISGYSIKFIISKQTIHLIQMASTWKNLLNLASNREKDLQIDKRISQIQLLVRSLQREQAQNYDVGDKIKQILNLAWGNFDSTHSSLFYMIYESAMKDALIDWVPVSCKVINLLGPNSDFIKCIFKIQDLKIPIEKTFLPSFLFRNNLLTQKTGYINISNSLQGLVTPVIDYLLIRLAGSLAQISFIYSPNVNDLNSEYKFDEIFYYISRNPYLLLLQSYSEHFARSTGQRERLMKKLVSNFKMFFVDELLLKHRINRGHLSRYSTVSSLMSYSSGYYKLKPHYILVVYLLLRHGYYFFEEKDLYLSQIIDRFSSIIEKEDEIYFRFFFRLFLFTFCNNSIENQVIDMLDNATKKNGSYQLERYTVSDFIKKCPKLERSAEQTFQNSKTLLIKLLEKDYNYIDRGRVSFGFIRSFGCFLKTLESSKESRRDYHRMHTQGLTLQRVLVKCHKTLQKLKQKSKQKSSVQLTQKTLSSENLKAFQLQIEEIQQSYRKVYQRQFDSNKFQQDLQNRSRVLDKNFNLKGRQTDYVQSVQTFREDVELNCWKVPRKESQFELLFNFFYWLAKTLDKAIPGHKTRQQPLLNLRYFSNPYVFFSILVLIFLLVRLFL